MTLPMAVDFLDGDRNAHAFAISAILTIIVGATVAIACSGGRRGGLTQRQGFLFTSVTYLAFTAMATLPLMIGAPRLSFTFAFFEAMSAMTTSGGTVIVGLDDMPRGLLLWRLIMHWIGGIGVVLLAMVLLPVLNVGGMQILRTADFNTIDKIMPRAKDIAVSFGSVYVGLTVLCALAYAWSGLSAFDAWGHAMSTVATGGMANYDASFTNFPAGAQYVGTVFMLVGALSFVRYVQLIAGGPGPLFRDTQVRAFLAVYGAFCVALVVARLLRGDDIDEPALREIAFNIASIISTTGFASADYGQWGSLATVIIFCAMMIGGCSGSTSGGPKVFRYQLLLTSVAAEIKRLYSPNQVITVRYQGRPVSEDVMNSVVAFMMFFFLTLGIGAVLLVMIGLDPVTAVSGATASLSNVGPGLGPQIGPVGNFAGQPDTALWVMSFLMLIGRLEILTLYVLFTATFWRA